MIAKKKPAMLLSAGPSDTTAPPVSAEHFTVQFICLSVSLSVVPLFETELKEAFCVVLVNRTKNVWCDTTQQTVQTVLV